QPPDGPRPSRRRSRRRTPPASGPRVPSGFPHADRARRRRRVLPIDSPRRTRNAERPQADERGKRAGEDDNPCFPPPRPIESLTQLTGVLSVIDFPLANPPRTATEDGSARSTPPWIFA